MSCRQFKPVAMSTGSCSRIWSGGFCFASHHSSLLLQVHIDLADIPWKAMRNQFKIVKWKEQIWGKRRKSCSPLLPHACVCVLYQSFHRDCRCLTFSCYSHSCGSCIQLCYRKQMLWHIYPYLVMQSSPAHSVELLCVEFRKQRCFPVSLQESWTFPLCYPVRVLLCFPWECLWASCIRLAPGPNSSLDWWISLDVKQFQKLQAK